MREVFIADSPAQAHLVTGLLEEEGIRAVVEGEMLFGARGELGLSASTLPRVCVNDEDAARAITILRERHEARTAEPPDLEDAADAGAAPSRPWWRRPPAMAMLWLGFAARSLHLAGEVAPPVAGRGAGSPRVGGVGGPSLGPSTPAWSGAVRRR